MFPAQPSPQQIVLRAEVMRPPLALAGDPALHLLRIGLIVGYDELGVPANVLPRGWAPRFRPAGTMAHRRSPFAHRISARVL